jgi:hypothetical protein
MVKRARKSKVRRTHRKGTRRATRKMRGGYLELSPSGVTNTGMDAPYKINMLQGQEYASQHSTQHGGYQNMPVTNSSSMNMPSMNSSSMNMPSMNSSSMNMPSMNNSSTNVPLKMPTQMGGVAPVGDSGVLDSNLRESARLGPLDQSFQEIAGMTDQAGGRRRRRKGRKSRKSRKGGRSRRKMRGGSSALMAASTNANPMLLDGRSSSSAVTEMNPEWKLAENPNSFAPQK